MTESSTQGSIGEFEGKPFFEMVFHWVYDDLTKLFPGKTSIPSMITINQFPPFTRTAVLMLRESMLRRCSVFEAAIGMGMDFSDWNDWTVAYATDSFMQHNNPVIYL